MRVQHHFSIILFVAVVGAIGLAGAVGVLLGGLEDAAHEFGTASDQQQRVQQLVTEGEGLLGAVNGLTIRSSEESFAVVDRAIEQSLVRLIQLRHASLVFQPEPVLNALRELEDCRQLAATRSAGVQHPDQLEQLRTSVGRYAVALGRINADASNAVQRLTRELARRRRVIMLTIGVICFLYLAAIERIRHWTTRHLIDPIQKLADAARQAMKGGTATPELAGGKTAELDTLANMLVTFAETIKTKVHERTAQVVHQKEILEKEVRVRRRTEDELRYSALRDTLTGLCNRDLLMSRIGLCLQRAARREGYVFAALFIDVDQFHEANTAGGRVFGDHLVIAVADRLKQGMVDAADEFGVECSTLARIGGDEFVVLLDGMSDRDHAEQIAQRLHERLSEPFEVQGRKRKLSASIGIALHEEEIESAEELIRNADAAMHFAKAGGKGRYSVFRPGMQDEVTAREETGTRLRAALDKGEFHVVYQPIVSLRTGRLSGFEALARWDSPERGAVSPVEFIADAEDSGVIVQLGRWVLEQACRQMRVWRDEFPQKRSMAMSVNVSRQQLAQPEFVDHVQEILRETGVDSTSLKLEITESVIMENPDSVAEALRRLKTLGAEIHMDDFGTGYSSLSYLHRLPIDVLKIDRAFMSSLSANNDYSDVVHTVVALARTLQMQVTVEGVEAEDQLTRLQALDCDYAQGYLFSKPMKAEAAAEMIDADRRWLTAAA